MVHIIKMKFVNKSLISVFAVITLIFTKKEGIM